MGYLSSAPIGNTLEDALYQTERYDRSSGPELEYSFSVPNGDYEVKLHFAENYPSAQTLGGRVFDVAIEGVLALSDFDIFEVAGSSSAHIETILTSVTDGNLVITFDRIVQNPKISAIEFTSVEEVTPPDTTAPVITLSGDDPLVLAMGASSTRTS